MSERPPIVCLSHLVWDRTLFQRPQQIMTRMAALGHPVLFLSRLGTRQWLALRARGRRDLLRGAPTDNLAWRTRAIIPLAGRLRPLHRLDMNLTARTARRWLGDSDNAILWTTHPVYVDCIDAIPHRHLVFDVMDPFQSFRGSTGNTLSLEDQLLARANTVFTGGRALQESIVERRPDAHCFSSGIDLEHFGRARDTATPLPNDLRDLSRPILGYFGAVDERLDFDLMREICRARPDWSLVLLGPLIPGTEITVAEPNFHWLGPKPYAELPGYLRGFDVAIMPWVQSELTAHISPTKTPEYLAGGKPVVSVPIRDVERNYGDIVLFGNTPEAFIAAAEQALAQRDRDWAATILDHPHAKTWDQIAREMDDLIAAKSRS